MEQQPTIEQLAQEYDLQVDFLTSLYDKVEDKDNFPIAVNLFANGLLPYELATGNQTINVDALRKDIIRNITEREQRANIDK